MQQQIRSSEMCLHQSHIKISQACMQRQ